VADADFCELYTFANGLWQIAQGYVILSLPPSETAMNRYERRPLSAGEAELEYLDGEIRVLRPGTFVRCAATGVPIPIEDLRYWNVDLQEPYANHEAKLLRMGMKLDK
jgi:hypothetical protein